MPEVAVARVGILLRGGDGDAPRRGIVDGVLARRDVPLAPRRDERARRGRAEQVVVLVSGARLEDREQVVLCELVLCVDEEELGSAGLLRLLFEARGLLGLADVYRHGHDRAAVILLEPGNDDGCVEPARVSERDLLDLRLHEIFSFGGSWRISSSALTNPDKAGRCLLYTSPSPRDGLLSRMPS